MVAAWESGARSSVTGGFGGEHSVEEPLFHGGHEEPLQAAKAQRAGHAATGLKLTYATADEKIA